GCAFLNAAAELPEEHPAHEVIRYHKHSICDRLEELVKEDAGPGVEHRLLANHLFLLLEGAFAHRPIYGTSMLQQGREMARRLLDRGPCADGSDPRIDDGSAEKRLLRPARRDVIPRAAPRDVTAGRYTARDTVTSGPDRTPRDAGAG